MSKRGFGCLVVGFAMVMGCGGSVDCPDGYERMGGLCVQTAVDAAQPFDAAVEQDGAPHEPDAGADGAVEVDAAMVEPDGSWIEPDAAVEVDAAMPCIPHEEVCNEVDDDCDEAIDEAIKLPSVMDDADLDGFGDDATSRLGCVLAGRVTMGGDCDDHDASRHPGATEVCDGIDQNCTAGPDEGVTLVFYRDADGDGHGSPTVTAVACAAPVSFVASSDDCNDAVATIYTGATEICDDVDQDCDGVADDGLSLVTYYTDADHDGFAPFAATTVGHCARTDGMPPAGTTARAPTGPTSRDCFDTDARAFPGQTAFFSMPIVGAPSTLATRFDFDCDGSLERRYGVGNCQAMPPLACSSIGTIPGFDASAGVACGASGTLVTACGPVWSGGVLDACHATTRPSTPQECH